MIKIFTLILILVVCGRGDDTNPLLGKSSSEGVRQKRLLFYDEEGNLVKTYTNPYLRQFTLNPEQMPFYGNFLNPFFSFIRAFGNSIAAFTIPVSNEVIQHIKEDPNYQNKLVIVPKKDLVVEPNPLCEGKRTQIPSPKRCNNFLNCWDGWAFEQECPAGLLFSNQGYCDYSDNVDCNNRQVPSDKLQVQPLCSSDFEAFRNKLDCSEFFVCVNRQPIRFKCPADLAYSQILGVCDYADRVDCKSSATITAVAPSGPPQPAADPAASAFASTAPPAPALPPVPMIPEAVSKPSDDQLGSTGSSIFLDKGCAAHIAMSRQDAISHLQLHGHMNN